MEKKDNILIITNSFPNPLQPHRGIYIKQLVDRMKGQINPIILCPLPWFPRYSFLKNFEQWYFFANIPKVYKFEDYLVFSTKYTTIPKLSSQINSLFMIPGLFQKIYKISRLPGFDLIHVHNIFPEGIAGVILGKLFKKPVILSARGSDINDATKNGRIRLSQTMWALKNAENITAVSIPLCEKIIDMGVDKSRVHYIPNGVDTDKFFPKERFLCRKELGIDKESKMLLFVGKLRLVKGLHNLIRALAVLDERNKLDFETVIIGSGDQENDLRKEISKKKLEGKVLFKGNLLHDQISTWMCASDAFCLPSINEGMPNVVLEALSCGLPVVSTHVGGITDLINSDNGIVVPPGNVDRLAFAIEQVFRRNWNPYLISDSVKHLSWESSAKNYLEVITQTISMHNEPRC